VIDSLSFTWRGNEGKVGRLLMFLMFWVEMARGGGGEFIGGGGGSGILQVIFRIVPEEIM